MAIENKWKTSSPETTPEFENIILETPPTNPPHLGIRSDWTLQRKIGVAMGIVGVILVIIGIAPMMLENDNLKGNIATEKEQEEQDPLSSLFKQANSNLAPTTKTTPEIDTSGASITSGGLKSFGENSSETNTTNTLSTEEGVMPAKTASTDSEISSEKNTKYSGTSQTSLTTEVDKILEKDTTAFHQKTSVSINNSNIGKTDTLGSEFMTENPNTMETKKSSQETFHSAAGLQNTTTNTSTKNNLSNSGPADTALILFLLSLFTVGGLRYFRKV